MAAQAVSSDNCVRYGAGLKVSGNNARRGRPLKRSASGWRKTKSDISERGQRIFIGQAMVSCDIDQSRKSNEQE